MKNSKKRGFTIVELVIVIAVIAILAGVLIPTFVSVIKKGQEANDTALIKYLNTSLTAGTIGGKAPETMQGALDIVEADGYNVAKIKATASGARILWDSKNNCFVYLKDGENEPTYIPDSKTQNVANVDYWQITEADEDLSGTYSNYLALGYTKDLSNVQTGLDVGQNDNIAAITYKGTGTAQKVVINMNGGTLTVDAVTDDVYRYGTADKVIITAVAPTSYHECGEVIGNIELTNGRVVLESGAKAAAVKVVATADAISNGSAVVAVDNKAATTVSVVVPAEVKTAIETKGGNNKLAADASSIVSDATVIANMDKFAGGLGTEASPYLIATAEQLTKIADFSNNMLNGTSLYFALIADVALNELDSTTIVAKYFNGEFDGRGHTIVANASRNISLIEGTTGDVVIKNLEVKQYSTAHIVLVQMSNLYQLNNSNISTRKSVLFENITISAADPSAVVVMGNNDSSFTKYVSDNVSFVNCVNNADLTTSTYSGIFIGGYALSGKNKNSTIHSKVSFVNCVNNANVTGKSVGFFTGSANQSKFKYAANKDFSDATELGYSYAYVENCANNGVMIGTQDCGAFSRGNNSHIPEFNANVNDYLAAHAEKFKAGNMTESGINDMGLKVDGNNVSIVKSAASGIKSYQVDVYASTSYKANDGTSPGSNYVWIKFEIAENEIDTWKSTLITKIVTDKQYGTAFSAISGTEKTDIKGHKYKEVMQNDGTMMIVVDINTLLSEFCGNLAEATIYSKISYQITTISETGSVTGAKVYTDLVK